ncbi:MAG: PASTA domain-containing protein, partial [Ruminococcus sp.]|nr:PASTA domain-containing protein [Ruminococcus sp.]
DSSKLESKPSVVTTVTDEKVAKPDSSSQPEESSDDDGYGTGAVMTNVVGYRYDSVSDNLNEHFDVTVESFYSDDFNAGYITEQSIPEGTEYDPSRRHKLTLKVCQGSEYSTVPDFAGYTQESYLKKLGDLRIKYNVVETESSEPKGSIVKLSKSVGDSVNIKNGEELIVYVSTGEKETSIVTVTEPPEVTEPTQSQTEPPASEPDESEDESSEPDDEPQGPEQPNDAGDPDQD